MDLYFVLGLVSALFALWILIIIFVDWRNTKEINSLKVSDEVKLKAQQFVLKEFANIKPGLVLSGGGAKGAYQIGCWQALEELGITNFAALSGTSVGALNAALISQGKYDAAYNVWDNMGFSVVMKSSLLRLLLSVILRIPFLPFMILRYLPKLKRYRAPGFYEAISFYNKNSSLNGIQPYRALKATYRALGTYYGKLSQVLSPIILFILMTPFVEVPGSEAFLDILYFVAYGFWFITVAFFLWFIVIKIERYLAKNLPLFSNQPLLELLEKHCENGLQPGSAPVLVTLATIGIFEQHSKQFEEVEDKVDFEKSTAISDLATEGVSEEVSLDQANPPTESLSWLSWFKYQLQSPSDFGEQPGTPYSNHVEVVSESSGGSQRTVEYIPHYFHLQRLSVKKTQQLILQSAGLPEIFPMKTIAGADYVDGGIVDNTPLLPLIEGGYSDSLIVVSLDARAKTKELYAEVSRLEKLVRYAEPVRLEEKSWVKKMLPSLHDKINNSRLLYNNEFIERKVNTWHIIPSKSLGNFLTGTLNFFPYKSRALIKLGYYDIITYFASAPSPEKYHSSLTS